MAKKLLMSLMLTATIFALTACSGTPEKAADTENVPTTTEEEAVEDTAATALMAKYDEYASKDYNFADQFADGKCPAVSTVVMYSPENMFNHPKRVFEAKSNYFYYIREDLGGVYLANFEIPTANRSNPWDVKRGENDILIRLSLLKQDGKAIKVGDTFSNISYELGLPNQKGSMGMNSGEGMSVTITHLDNKTACGTFGVVDEYGDVLRGAFNTFVTDEITN